MDLFVGVAELNVIPDGSGYKSQGEPPREELALNAAQLRVFVSRPVCDAFRAFERKVWAFYNRHLAGDRAAAAAQRSTGIDDPLALLPDRQALANALDTFVAPHTSGPKPGA